MSSPLDSLPKIGAPATRALHGAGYTTLGQLAGVPRADLARLHGMGPKALGIIEAALAEHGLHLGQG
ncbi:MAG TPA: helix-hairpin-helix domain-containing protein [Micromonosporaceae bacterium]|nr:helix-hairpin-helix domain-containing protein [Micromonosporaceae bacterium]